MVFVAHQHVININLQFSLLKQLKLPPSNASWDVMEMASFLPHITSLIGMFPPTTTVNRRCTLTEIAVNTEMCINSIATNEGCSTLLCGNFVSHAVTDINDKEFSGVRTCKFEIFPVVREEVDKCENKKADFSIFKIFNELTYIVIELKLSVGGSLNTQDHDIYAQVLLEAYYAYHKDGKQQANSTMLCVVTDGTTWHLFTTNFNCRPFAFKILFFSDIVVCQYCLQPIYGSC